MYIMKIRIMLYISFHLKLYLITFYCALMPASLYTVLNITDSASWIFESEICQTMGIFKTFKINHQIAYLPERLYFYCKGLEFPVSHTSLPILSTNLFFFFNLFYRQKTFLFLIGMPLITSEIELLKVFWPFIFPL